MLVGEVRDILYVDQYKQRADVASASSNTQGRVPIPKRSTISMFVSYPYIRMDAPQTMASKSSTNNPSITTVPSVVPVRSANTMKKAQTISGLFASSQLLVRLHLH